MSNLKKVTVTDSNLTKIKSDFLAVGLFEDGSLTGIGSQVDKSLKGAVKKAFDLKDLKGKEEETQLFYNGADRYLVVGLGKKEKFDPVAMRKAGGTVAKFAVSRKFDKVAAESFGNENDALFTQALAEGLILGSYQFDGYKTGKEDKIFPLKTAVILDGNRTGARQGSINAASVCYARDIENHPGNVVTPSYLAKAAGDIAREGGMKLTVFDRDKIEKIGMGGLAGVASGSDEPPKFILLEYYGGKKGEKPVALVGKGLTFDSGGISIKPATNMDEMKYDMCGAGVVLGVMKAVAQLKPKKNIVAAIPSTENLSGGRAVKPGDILTAYNGKTIEVLNTDAEGRLILADGLSYVCKHHDPEFIFDFATLTGAVVIALGHVCSGIMGTDEKLIKEVKESSLRTGEKVWEFPLWQEYRDQVKSKIADVRNIGEPRQAGTIAAGAFLEAFVKKGTPWVHFDIAGTAYGMKENPYLPKHGATGETIRLVLDVLANR